MRLIPDFVGTRIATFHNDAPEHDEQAIINRRVHVLTHELNHVLSQNIPSETHERFSFGQRFQGLFHEIWTTISADLPGRQDLTRSAYRSLLIYLNACFNVLVLYNPHTDQSWTAATIDMAERLDNLLRNGRLRWLEDGRISSSHQEGCAAWRL